MATHKIYLAISKKVNDKINMDLDSIILGCVLLDICEEKDLERLTNPEKFLQKYREKLNNPIMIGYLIHLLTDKFLMNTF